MIRRKGAAWPGFTGLVVLTLALLAAAACATPPQGRKEPAAAKTMVDTVTDEQPAKSVKVESATSIRSEKLPAAPQLEPTPKTVRQAVSSDPAQLMGLAPDAINLLLGPPSLLRTEPPAQVWQYKVADCVLDIFLYSGETETENARVIYFEIRDGKTAPRSIRACFANILESRMIRAGTTP